MLSRDSDILVHAEGMKADALRAQTSAIFCSLPDENIFTLCGQAKALYSCRRF
jgi:hypothetical protein